MCKVPQEDTDTPSQPLPSGALQGSHSNPSSRLKAKTQGVSKGVESEIWIKAFLPLMGQRWFFGEVRWSIDGWPREAVITGLAFSQSCKSCRDSLCSPSPPDTRGSTGWTTGRRHKGTGVKK